MSALVDRRIEGSAIALSLILGVALVPACMKKAGDGATAPASAGSADQVPARDRDPLAELDHLEGRMRELGVAPASTAEAKQADIDDARDKGGETLEEGAERAGVQATEVQPMPAPTAARVEEGRDEYEDENRCTTVCALNEQICELEVQICSMAKNHGSDPIYADACERAVDDCELSGNACDTCVE